MQLHYIYHSCFALEETDFLIVYDYWKDRNDLLGALLERYRDKDVYFIISHFHEDHYNPDIPAWCAQNGRWHILPSYDTVRRRRIDKELPLAVLRMRPPPAERACARGPETRDPRPAGVT